MFPGHPRASRSNRCQVDSPFKHNSTAFDKLTKSVADVKVESCVELRVNVSLKPKSNFSLQTITALADYKALQTVNNQVNQLV